MLLFGRRSTYLRKSEEVHVRNIYPGEELTSERLTGENVTDENLTGGKAKRKKGEGRRKLVAQPADAGEVLTAYA